MITIGQKGLGGSIHLAVMSHDEGLLSIDGQTFDF